MRRNPWKAVPAAALVCLGLAPLTALAQQPASTANRVETARVEFPEVAGPETGSSAPANDAAEAAPATPAAPATGTAAATTTPAPAASVTVPVNNDLVIKELAEMKARIAQLEAELKARSGADDAASAERDANALRNAEGGDDSGSPTMGAGQAATPPPAAAAPPPPEITAETTTKSAPFSYFDQTWLNSGGHNVDSPMSTKYFTPEIRFDTNYILDYNHPEDDSMVGSTEMYRSDEFQVEQASVGGDFRIQNTRGRILYMDGLFSQATVRNDSSYNRGQWDLKDAYKYFSEAWGGYHWDVGHGLNVDGGIFVSYIGMFSYYNFDNWSYQPSFVSSNTPWFFNGLRIQYWPTAKIKIEPWIINGWQSYARYNGHGGLGGQIIWRPTPKLHFNFNNYGLGEDAAGFPGRSRVHADYTSQYKFYDKPKSFFDKAAWTMTGDLGCEYGGGPVSFATTNGTLNQKGLSPLQGTTDTYNGGVDCHGGKGTGRPKQMFAGWMSYVRLWMYHDRHAITLGGGQMNNPGRYLTLLPSINGSTASTGTPYYTENAGDRAQMHDMTFTYDYMPSQFIVFRLEQAYRYSDTPYWSGRGFGNPLNPGLNCVAPCGAVTPPGGNNGNPADYQCAAGGDSGVGYVSTNSNTGVGQAGLPIAELNCENLGLSNTVTGVIPNATGSNALGAVWWPDLVKKQWTTMGAIMVRF
jgi:Putative beta-barrel porin-2, OmpL-like. bbp2